MDGSCFRLEPDAEKYKSHTLHRGPHTRCSPQKTPHATPQWPRRLCWSSTATANRYCSALPSSYCLCSARFTYSLLHSLAANRLWTSRLSIMEGSLTVLWQPCWIDSSAPLFIFACLCQLIAWRVPVSCLHRNSRSNRLNASSSSTHPNYPCHRAEKLTLTK